MPKNNFSGISIAYSVISTYYPVNYRNPYFDHFVFQPTIPDGTSTDNDFSLAIYAVDGDGTVLNDGNPLTPTTPLNDKVPGTKPNIQFANYHLDLTALGSLYPPGITTDLIVYPSGSYYKHNGKETAYVLYIAESGDGVDVVLTTPINPSPPY
jgi:hypothetical protein